MNDTLKIKMLKDMMRIRKFEEQLYQLFLAGALPGFLHLYLGEEAIAVGVCSALNKDDYITSTHRGHGHVIAKGADTAQMMAELYGKRTGCNKGKGGSMHIAVPELGILGANGIVGAGLPLATGAALSAKYQKNNKVAVCFFGDGASNQGTFHEAVNIAAAYSLPVVYVCENNQYGANTAFSRISKTINISDRAAAYGMPALAVDGNDPEEVYGATMEAVKYARGGKGPFMIEALTYRWTGHCLGDMDLRPEKDIEDWKLREPIKRYINKLVSEDVLKDEMVNRFWEEAKDEIDKAVKFGQDSPEPDLETALTDVYTA